MNALTLSAWSAAFFLASCLFSHTVALRMILLFTAAACAGVAIAADRRSLRVLPPVWPAFALWGLWAALSMLWSLDPALSEKEWRNELFYSGLAFVVCHVAAQAERSERIFLAVLPIAALALCGNAVYDQWRSAPISPDGWHGGPGNLSAMLLILLPCVLAAGWYAVRTGAHAFAVAAAGLGAVVLVAGYAADNRTVWLAFALQALLAGGLVQQRSSPRIGKRAWIAGALIVVTGIAMAALVHQERLASKEATPLASDPRFEVWAAAASLVGDRPLTGYGFGRGMLHEPLVRLTGNPMLWHSHNLLLDATLQTGLVGLLLLAALFGWTALVGWRLARSADDKAAACGIALVAIVLGTLTRNMTDLVWQRHPALVYWGVVGALMAWGAGKARGRLPA